MEIRDISIDDQEAYKHIVSQSFERGQEVNFPSDTIGDPNNPRIGAYEKGRLQATLRILDFQMFFGEDRRPCGGIASVACDPAARGRGFAGSLLKRSLEMMREKGQYLSSLWPFDFRFYQRYGWEWTGESRNYSLPLRLLWSDPEAQYVEGVYDHIEEALNPVYEALATRYNGALVRGEKRWNSQTRAWNKRAPAVYLYRRDGRAEGYAILRYTDKQEEAHVTDFVALTMRAYRGLLGLFHRHAMTVEKIEWHAPADDVFSSILAHWDVETKLYPCAMSRIVDVRAALQARKPERSVRGAAVFALQDEHAPWNAGAWKVSVEDGHVEIARSNDSPGVELDIQALTQAYWGTPSLAALRRAERLTVHDESDYRILSVLLPAKIVWLADDF